MPFNVDLGIALPYYADLSLAWIEYVKPVKNADNVLQYTATGENVDMMLIATGNYQTDSGVSTRQVYANYIDSSHQVIGQFVSNYGQTASQSVVYTFSAGLSSAWVNDNHEYACVPLPVIPLLSGFVFQLFGSGGISDFWSTSYGLFTVMHIPTSGDSTPPSPNQQVNTAPLQL